jgi:hypothetical protein
MEQHARAALDQVYEWPDTRPKLKSDPRGPAARAEAIRFVDDAGDAGDAGQEVFRLTYGDVWKERRSV